MNKFLSSLVLVGIVTYGFLRILICRIYSNLITQFLVLIGLDPEVIYSALFSLKKDSLKSDHILGWIIYYPSYLGLHLLFIWLLFYHQQKLRKQLMIALLVVVFGLLIVIFISKVFAIETLYQLSYHLFQTLFGLPFILLTIEGGRILIRDIDKKLKQN